jgi:c-di-GMP-binding flagellar brake protein YcgR
MKVGDKCVIQPQNEKEFHPFVSTIKNVKNRLVEIETGEFHEIFVTGKTFIIEVKNGHSLKKYKASVRKTGRTTMLCLVSEHSIRDRRFSRVNAMIGTGFRLWNERGVLHRGLCTNISGNGMILRSEAYASPGELVLIEMLKLYEDFNLSDNIVGRVIKFKHADENDEDYNYIAVNFTHINKNDRLNIIKFVNKKQKQIKDEGLEDETEETPFDDDKEEDKF